jgi:hypothetical protein
MAAMSLSLEYMLYLSIYTRNSFFFFIWNRIFESGGFAFSPQGVIIFSHFQSLVQKISSIWQMGCWQLIILIKLRVFVWTFFFETPRLKLIYNTRIKQPIVCIFIIFEKEFLKLRKAVDVRKIIITTYLWQRRNNRLKQLKVYLSLDKEDHNIDSSNRAEMVSAAHCVDFVRFQMVRRNSTTAGNPIR